MKETAGTFQVQYTYRPWVIQATTVTIALAMAAFMYIGIMRNYGELYYN